MFITWNCWLIETSYLCAGHDKCTEVPSYCMVGTTPSEYIAHLTPEFLYMWWESLPSSFPHCACYVYPWSHVSLSWVNIIEFLEWLRKNLLNVFLKMELVSWKGHRMFESVWAWHLNGSYDRHQSLCPFLKLFSRYSNNSMPRKMKTTHGFSTLPLYMWTVLVH